MFRVSVCFGWAYTTTWSSILEAHFKNSFFVLGLLTSFFSTWIWKLTKNHGFDWNEPALSVGLSQVTQFICLSLQGAQLNFTKNKKREHNWRFNNRLTKNILNRDLDGPICVIWDKLCGCYHLIKKTKEVVTKKTQYTMVGSFNSFFFFGGGIMSLFFFCHGDDVSMIKTRG